MKLPESGTKSKREPDDSSAGPHSGIGRIFKRGLKFWPPGPLIEEDGLWKTLGKQWSDVDASNRCALRQEDYRATCL